MPEGRARGPARGESESAVQPEPAAAEVECEQGALAGPGNRAVTGWVRDAGPGRPLDPVLRAELEPAFDEELGTVRIHDDGDAQRAARDANAHAFVHGEHVVLDASLREVLERAGGRKLLAHELAHVVQQRRGGAREPSPAPGTASEAEADAAAGAVAGGGTAPALSGSAVGVARTPRDVAGLTEQELLAEHESTQQWLLEHKEGDPGYQETLDYFQRLDRESINRPAATSSGTTSKASTSTSSSADATSASSTTEQLASVDPNAPLAPEDMVSHVVNQRAFIRGERDATGAIPELNAQGEALGTGYSTNSMVQVVDADGKQVATESSRYGSRADDHAEIQALDALRARLGGKQVPGGKLVVAVDQNTCGNCTAAIRKLAGDHGLEVIEVYGPGRGRVNNPSIPVTPKTAARTAYSGIEGAPPTQTELLWGETVAPAGPGGGGGTNFTPPQPNASSVSEGEGGMTPVPDETGVTPVANEGSPGPVVESTTTTATEGTVVAADPVVSPGEGSGIEMVPGSGSAALSVGIGVAYSIVHQAAMNRKRDTEGFAPVGPDPEEGILTRLGRFFADPTMGDNIPAAGRFNLPVWRSRVRSIAGAKKTGETLRMSWEREKPGILPGMVTHDSVDVEYVRQPDGTFGPGKVVDGDSEGFAAPDINRVIDSNVSNDSIMYMLSDHSNEA